MMNGMSSPMVLSQISANDLSLVLQASGDTAAMLMWAFPLTCCVGLPIGILLYLLRTSLLRVHSVVYLTLGFSVNIVRSIPFILLMIALIPLTLRVMGTSLGVRGAILPLVVGAAPMYARLVEASLLELDRGIIEATLAMGATRWQLVRWVLLPEARPGLISAATVTAVALVSFTAMGGAIGSGGLGDVAYREGYLRSHWVIAFIAVVGLIIVVQVLQMIGDRLAALFKRDSS